MRWELIVVKRRLLSGLSAFALAAVSLTGAVITGVGLSPAAAVNSPCNPTTSTSGGYTIVKFAAGAICDWEVPAGVTALDLLVVAGGGGGGGMTGTSPSYGGGGGGAGEVYESTSSITVQPADIWTITVGGGGAGGGTGADGTDGSDTSVTYGSTPTTVTANGGGGGGGGQSGTGNAGGNGGSGGGGGAGGTADGVGGSSTLTASGHGYDGSDGGIGGTGTLHPGGAGGGAGGVPTVNGNGDPVRGPGFASFLGSGTTELVGVGGNSYSSLTQQTAGSGGAGALGGNPTAAAGRDGVVAIRYVASGGGGGSSDEPAPVLVPLHVRGAVCSVDDVWAYTGTWVTLSVECARPANVAANAVLLGWATTPDFPVSIAQRQSDNKWGEYEIRAEDGTLAAVFVPARWQTFVTSENTIYPIWSK